MPQTHVSLDVIDVAYPCTQSWDLMRGDERVRHCRHCNQNVFNLSDVTREEAEQLISQREGRLCVRFYRRADGTVVTTDCAPIRLKAARRAARLALTAF